ncbi:hypothetical protein QZH41_020579 [Actinostola sp. cb2023]|nr:hypothetical protein QZH41_020579 [Actinostola sp. cb2023]
MHGDIEFMHVPRGVNFGRRILWLLEWATKNYVFDFVLRVDDDVFVCLQRLLFELPHRQERRLYWGHVHCTKDQVRVDEEFLLLSSDLVDEFLKVRESLLCNPFGDISVALWVNNVRDVTYFHDQRVYHEANSAHHELFAETSLCHKYLALNSAYKTESLRYWINVQHETTNNFDIVHVKPFVKVCNQSRYLKWREFALGHRFEPVRCVRKPTWNLLGHIYLGRKGEEAKKNRKMKMIYQQQRTSPTPH